jgi:hypothetical protein
MICCSSRVPHGRAPFQERPHHVPNRKYPVQLYRIRWTGGDHMRPTRVGEIHAWKKVWLPAEVGGRPWTSKDAESSLENRFFGRLLDVYGHQWTSTDVLGWLPGPDSKSIVNC